MNLRGTIWEHCRVEGEPVRPIPLEDVASIIITSFSASLHTHLLLEAARHGAALILCESFKPEESQTSLDR